MFSIALLRFEFKRFENFEGGALPPFKVRQTCQRAEGVFAAGFHGISATALARDALLGKLG